MKKQRKYSVGLFNQPWAMLYLGIEDLLLDIDFALNAFQTELARSEESVIEKLTGEPFIRDGNIAIIPVNGTLVKTGSLFTEGTRYGYLRRALSMAEQAKGIDAIMLDVDTPGGTVAGVHETAELLYRVNQRKPVYAWVDDLAASAGYWLVSQCSMIGAHAGGDVGSIGIFTMHYDYSERDLKYGVRRTVMAVGDLKAAGHDAGPLPDKAEKYIMDLLNRTQDIFVNTVSRGRPKLSTSKVRATQGRLYMGEQARKMGLIDEVMGRDDFIDLVKRRTALRDTVSTSWKNRRGN